MVKRERTQSEQRRTKRQSKNKRGCFKGSEQAVDNLALTFQRHLQSRFHRNHNNQFLRGSENIKHVMFTDMSRVENCPVVHRGLPPLQIQPSTQSKQRAADIHCCSDWNHISQEVLQDYKP